VFANRAEAFNSLVGRSAPGAVLAFAQRLQTLGRTYELVVYAKDNHGLFMNRAGRDRRIVEWFKRHMK
jgi:dipeptidyl aminopeptidase/acylaminoacyl peptidase